MTFRRLDVSTFHAALLLGVLAGCAMPPVTVDLAAMPAEVSVGLDVAGQAEGFEFPWIFVGIALACVVGWALGVLVFRRRERKAEGGIVNGEF